MTVGDHKPDVTVSRQMAQEERWRPEDARPDAELWQLITLDDHEAFTELFERHAKAIWNYAYRLTASWAAAEDLLAEAFLVAWRRRGDVRLVRESALPWLYTVTNNLRRDEGRRKRRFLRLARDGVGHQEDPVAHQRAQLGPGDLTPVASIGNIIAICTQRGSAPIDLQLVDVNGYFDTDVIEDNTLITADSVFYGFQAGQGGSGSDHVSIVGLLLGPQAASVRLTWPGGPNLVATVANGSYALPGYDLDDPSLRGAKPRVSVYDAYGARLGSYEIKQ